MGIFYQAQGVFDLNRGAGLEVNGVAFQVRGRAGMGKLGCLSDFCAHDRSC